MKLLLKGAELESQSSNGRTPLSWAAARSWYPGGRHKAVVKLLLEKGTELESKGESKDGYDGRTPLSSAAGTSGTRRW